MLKIAIADDEIKIREYIFDMLYKDSGKELLSYLSSHTIHIILLDIQMKCWTCKAGF